jgi:selenocysteine lyase/cysteine desulfurase
MLDLAALRRQIPALDDSIYLNAGTFGPPPTCVLDEIRGALDLIEKHGPYSPLVREAIERRGYEQTRVEVAQLLGVSTEEILLVRSASDAINVVAHGLDWEEGDEVVIGREEHQSGILPWLILSQRRGIRVRVAAVSPDPETTVQNFRQELSTRTRLLFASHVSGISGIRLPARALSRLAHEHGALAVIDGAHALGQFPVDVSDVGCDAYVGCGHKWLLGPQGTSMAYVSRERLETFKPSWIGWGAQEAFSLDLAAQRFTLHPSARKFEFGTKQWSLFLGLGAAIRFISQIGFEAIVAHVQPLAARLKEAVAARPQVTLLTPTDPDLSSGIVSIRLPRSAPENVGELLWERQRMLVAYWHPLRRLRFSVACFTSDADVEEAVAALAALSTGEV